MVERKHFKTKLCILYQRGGRCPRQNCSFAHGNAELRQSFGSFHGKRDYRGGDLRNKLEKRLSPQRRYSPIRDARGHGSFHGFSPSRSFEKNSDRNRRKRQQIEGQSNFSGSLRVSDGAEDRVKRRKRSVSSDSRGVLKEQLKEVQSNIDMLDHRKSQLRISVEEKVEEAVSLTSQIQELEAQLSYEKEESKRLSSKIKKFVKVHKHFVRAQEELKRSQIRLQKLGDQLGTGTNPTGRNEEDSGINIVSDAETPGYCTISPRNHVQNNSSLAEKHLGIKYRTAEESRQGILTNSGNDGGNPAETVTAVTLSRLNLYPSQSNINNEVETMDNRNGGNQHMGIEQKQKKGKNVSLKVSGTGLVVPSTSMAAHAIDDPVEIEGDENIEVVETAAAAGIDKGANTHEVRKLPFPVPLPPLAPRNSYSQYGGEDEKVDAEGWEEEMVNVEIV